jgi:hypothetical protein
MSHFPNHRTLLESLLRRLPVNHIPYSLEVLRLPVLVLQVIGMLPSINTQEWCELSNHWVLVGICSDKHLSCLVVFYKPCPTTALDSCKRGIEFGLEIGEGAVGGFDC